MHIFYTSEKTDNTVFHYMLWFQPSDGWILFDDSKNEWVVFLDGRYYESNLETWDFKFEKVLANKKFTELLSTHIDGTEKIFLEKQLPYVIREKLGQWSTQQYGSDIFVFEESSRQKDMRITKKSKQIEKIEKAIQINKTLRQAILDLWSDIIGMSELEVRAMLIMQAMSLGAEWEAFDTIVATGANTALPHHNTSTAIIWAWPLLIDMGWKVDGWCSDMTRCMWIEGKKNSPLRPPHWGGEREEFEKILSVTQQAYQTAIDMVAPGVKFADIAVAARGVIDDAWYGEYYTHSLGHGVGLDIHEAPRVGTTSEDVVETWMVFTIEPGIYLPGKFGVRWEDIIIVE